MQAVPKRYIILQHFFNIVQTIFKECLVGTDCLDGSVTVLVIISATSIYTYEILANPETLEFKKAVL